LIVEKTRKNDVFEILITFSREAFRIYGTRARGDKAIEQDRRPSDRRGPKMLA
jgi:hypothetical protein